MVSMFRLLGKTLGGLGKLGFSFNPSGEIEGQEIDGVSVSDLSSLGYAGSKAKSTTLAPLITIPCSRANA